ncbi:MAG: TonB-dependent receptor [Betaproteobacteria bacterium]
MPVPEPRTHRPVALASLLLLAGGGAQAQSAPEPPQAAPQSVVVTATRTEARPFDVPASIDRIDGDAARDGRAQVNISESLAAVPGLLARDRQNYAQDVQISVRGFGARASFGLRGVRVYVDGIPATFPDGQGQITNVDIGTIDRIEVLRGPASALYGNSAGGVIQVFTQDGATPSLVDAGVAFGSNGVQRENAKASGRAGAFGYVLGASHFQTDGYRDHSAARRDIANAKLTLDGADLGRFTLVANSVNLPEAQDPLGLTRALVAANPRGVDPAATTFNTRKSIDQSQLGLTWERALGATMGLRAMVYAGHRNTEQFQSITLGAQASPLSPGGVIALSSDYSGADARWTWRAHLVDAPFTVVAGIALDKLDQHRLGYQNFTGTGDAAVLGVQGALRRDEQDTASDVDPYLQATWQLTPDWSLSAGARHSSVRIASHDRYVTGPNGDDSGSRNYSETLPVVGVLYAVSPQVHLYANAGKGFETPTLNELAYRSDGAPGLNFGLSPATSNNLEAGVKAQWPGLGELTAAVFQTRTQDEIVTYNNTGGRSTYQNAGATRRRGIELGWSRTWFESLRAQLAWSTLDATYRNAFESCNLSPCPVASQQPVAAGNRMPGVARSNVYGALAWTPTTGWRGGVDLRALGKVFVNDINSDAAASYVVASANAGYVALVGAWRLTGFVRADNVFDRRYAGSVIVNEGNGRYFEPAPGRTWLGGVGATYTF